MPPQRRADLPNEGAPHQPLPLRVAALQQALDLLPELLPGLPLRLGEFIRPWALARRERLSKTTLFATVVVERAIDMVTLLVIFGLSLLVHPISGETEAGRMTQAGATVLVTACAALTGFVIALERSEKLARVVIERLSAPLPPHWRGRASRALDHFIHGLGLFRDLPRVLWVFALSFAMFGVIVLGLAGMVSPQAFVAFLFASVGLGVLLSVNAMVLEEISFHLYPRPRQQLKLFLVAVLENFGYRQLASLFRVIGLLRWMGKLRRRSKWGHVRRSADWHDEPDQIGARQAAAGSPAA